MAYDATKDPLVRITDKDRPSAFAEAVTPSDTVDLALYAQRLYIGVAGDVKVSPVNADDDNGVVFKAHPVGYLNCPVRRVFASGTTATNILALRA